MLPATIPYSIGNDRDLERRVVSFLESRHVPSLRHVLVEAADGRVTLRGHVHSWYEKQLCQSCCRRVAGVLQLIDDVVVSSHNTLSVAS